MLHYCWSNMDSQLHARYEATVQTVNGSVPKKVKCVHQLEKGKTINGKFYRALLKQLKDATPHVFICCCKTPWTGFQISATHIHHI